MLSVAERERLLALPGTMDDLIRHYRFSDTDLSISSGSGGAQPTCWLLCSCDTGVWGKTFGGTRFG